MAKANKSKKNKAAEAEVVEEVTTPKITAKALATELGTTDRELRKFLRDVVGKENKPGGRWEWDEDDEQLDSIREQYAAKKAGAAKDAEDEDDDASDADDDFDEDEID